MISLNPRVKLLPDVGSVWRETFKGRSGAGSRPTEAIGNYVEADVRTWGDASSTQGRRAQRWCPCRVASGELVPGGSVQSIDDIEYSIVSE
jgi:hypothetical protein